MTNTEQDLEGALQTIQTGWQPSDTEYVLALLRVRMQRQRTVRRASVALLAVLTAVGLFWAGLGQRSANSADNRSSPSSNEDIRFSDGSSVKRLEPATSVSVVEAGPERIIAAVERGQIEVAVTPRPERVFRILAGEVVVEALGTVFVVERQGERARVAVRHGRVRVSWPAASRELEVGEVGWFPPVEALQTGKEPERAAADHPPSPPTAAGASASTKALTHEPSSKETWTWKELALTGKNRESYALLRDQGKNLRDPEDLLLAADVARLSGHPAEAVPFLERLLKERSLDQRAPLAAFALGRVLMTSLGRPEQAALAFADARRRAKGGSLAEDALAREVEAWSRARATDRARELAKEYLRLYPKGQRAPAVRMFGGLE